MVVFMLFFIDFSSRKTWLGIEIFLKPLLIRKFQHRTKILNREVNTKLTYKYNTKEGTK